jgi:small subunit ribosomal protein S16
LGRLNRGLSSGAAPFDDAALLQVPRVDKMPGSPFFDARCASLRAAGKEIRMVVIRLARSGAKKRPFFSIVATDSRSARDGRFVERVGFYNPMATPNETRFRIAADRLNHWRSVGAQVSPTVARLVKTFANAGPSATGDGQAEEGRAEAGRAEAGRAENSAAAVEEAPQAVAVQAPGAEAPAGAA